MTRLFKVRVAERVIVTMAGAFISAFIEESSAYSFHPSTEAGIWLSCFLLGLSAGIVQLLLSVLVAPHVGDPHSPALLTSRVIQDAALKDYKNRDA